MIQVDETILKKYTFIDLFAGIGGFHLALQSFGSKCVFASEWDKNAAKTYEDNFGLIPFGDITQIKEQDIPNHDILCGGFPCQAFSVSGKQKGFEDTRGTLFFDIARIVNEHKPKVLFLENVKNLAKHDNGKTVKKIITTLENLDYIIFSKVLNSSNFGLPQNRERLFIVAFKNTLDASTFQFPTLVNNSICLNDILEIEPQKAKIVDRPDIAIYKNYSLLDVVDTQGNLPNKPLQIGKVNKGGQGERIYHPLGHAITLSAYGGGVGSKTGLYLINGKVRKLSPRECARVQGFPDSFFINPTDTQAYKQFGNSVSVNVLQYILIEISKVLAFNETNVTKKDTISLKSTLNSNFSF